uniref:Uncharacterized protein n=1 Tax=Anguilla anguilla TaxID=7936 RepID=A0A0E9PN11_ANGAN
MLHFCFHQLPWLNELIGCIHQPWLTGRLYHSKHFVQGHKNSLQLSFMHLIRNLAKIV